jgi:hypothetical protein
MYVENFKMDVLVFIGMERHNIISYLRSHP